MLKFRMQNAEPKAINFRMHSAYCMGVRKRTNKNQKKNMTQWFVDQLSLHTGCLIHFSKCSFPV